MNKNGGGARTDETIMITCEEIAYERGKLRDTLAGQRLETWFETVVRLLKEKVSSEDITNFEMLKDFNNDRWLFREKP